MVPGFHVPLHGREFTAGAGAPPRGDRPPRRPPWRHRRRARPRAAPASSPASDDHRPPRRAVVRLHRADCPLAPPPMSRRGRLPYARRTGVEAGRRSAPRRRARSTVMAAPSYAAPRSCLPGGGVAQTGEQPGGGGQVGGALAVEIRQQDRLAARLRAAGSTRRRRRRRRRTGTAGAGRRPQRTDPRPRPGSSPGSGPGAPCPPTPDPAAPTPRRPAGVPARPPTPAPARLSGRHARAPRAAARHGCPGARSAGPGRCRPDPPRTPTHSRC